MQPSTSPVGLLNSTDVLKTLRGGALTLVAGIVVEVLVEFRAMLEQCRVTPDQCVFDLNGYDFVLPSAIAVIGMALELIRRFKTNYAG